MFDTFIAIISSCQFHLLIGYIVFYGCFYTCRVYAPVFQVRVRKYTSVFQRIDKTFHLTVRQFGCP